MGLPLYALHKLRPHLKGAKVLSLSYPDIIVKKDTFSKEFGFMPTKFTNQNEKHSLKEPLPETMEVFSKFGATLECVDVVKNTGCEKIVDLNYPADLGKYDIVIDPGTLEHCFNIGQAMMNCANAVKPGGRIFHISPMTMMNHGFYNLCPTFFYDFYTQNNWELETLEALNGSKIRYNDIARFRLDVEYLLCCFSKRKTDAELKFPIQSKYLENITAKKAA